MTEHAYGAGAGEAANANTDELLSDRSGSRLAASDFLVPVGLDAAGETDPGDTLDTGAFSVADGGTQADAAAQRWAEARSGSLYRFVVGGEAVSAGPSASDGAPSAPVLSAQGSIPIPVVGGSAAGTGPDAAGAAGLALGEARGAGTSGGFAAGALATSSAQIGSSGGLVFNITFDSSVAKAPSGFVSAIEYVAQSYANTFQNPITINLDVGWGEIAGQRLSSGSLGESEVYLDNYSYSQLRSALAANATSADQQMAAATLPGSDPTGSNNYTLATAEAKALGLAGASSSLDGDVGFGSGYAYTFDPNNQAVSGAYDFIGVAAHEISEVMGRNSYLGEGLGYTPLDLFRYSSAGARQFTGGAAAYLSIDGGNTNLDSFNTDPSGDYGDWASSAGNDAYNAFSNSGVANTVTAADAQVLNVLGYSVAGAASPTSSPTPAPAPTPAPTPAPAPTPSGPAPSTPSGPSPSTLTLVDTTTGQTVSAAGSPYSGPVSGLQYQFVYAGTDSVNLTVSSDNWFLKSGPGNDAIQAYGGYNVLDGGTGSNFLTGGSGTDTFFADDRNSASDIWSTVNNFHLGDDATLFGITSADSIQWFDNQGAAGFTGLTVHASAPGGPTASLTLPGYSSSDLGNGRLGVQFSSEPDGTPYMHIIASG